MTVRFNKSDQRLLGTWRSDRARTVQFWGFKKGARIGPVRRKEFAKMFGKLTWRFTRNRCYTKYNEIEHTLSYTVVAADSDSVVLRWGESPDDEQLLQIHFESKGRFHVVSGWNVEFFRRVAT